MDMKMEGILWLYFTSKYGDEIFAPVCVMYPLGFN